MKQTARIAEDLYPGICTNAHEAEAERLVTAILRVAFDLLSLNDGADIEMKKEKAITTATPLDPLSRKRPDFNALVVERFNQT